MTDWQEIIDACWPAERIWTDGPWTHRFTPGAGGRVNGISGDALDQIDRAEAVAKETGRRPSFLLWPHQRELDAALAARGYVIEDAVHLYSIDTAALTAEPLPHATGFTIWPPLQIMRDIWQAGGIGPERQAVMARTQRPGGVFARADDRAAGVGFVAAHGNTALLSAVEVVKHHRRKGVSGLILRAAAHWAAAQTCRRVALVTTRDNLAANAAYASHDMEIVGGYHYRRAPAT
ncbi:MAG: GNAT family N-acetyltransferase [Pseudomonadota bacterium]